MGNIAIMMMGYSVMFGMNGALDTLVSQAYGAKDLAMCQFVLKVGRIVNCFIFLFVLIGFYQSKNLFIALGQNAQIAAIAYEYILSYTPAMFFLAHGDLQRRYLIQIGHSQK